MQPHPHLRHRGGLFRTVDEPKPDATLFRRIGHPMAGRLLRELSA